MWTCEISCKKTFEIFHDYASLLVSHLIHYKRNTNLAYFLQVKKLVQKVVTRDALNYRKMTDKTVPTPGEKEEAAPEEKELKVADIVKLSKGRGIMDDMYSIYCFIVGHALLDEMHNIEYLKIYVYILWKNFEFTILCKT